MTSNHLVIRADASTQMGTGHVMRCLALAEAWQDQIGSVTFACAQIPQALIDRLDDEKMSVHCISAKPGSLEDAQALMQCARFVGSTWLVIDGYQFDSDYQTYLKSAGFKVLFLDDYGHGAPYCADLVLNQNLWADPTLYEQRDAQTQLLLGTQYTLLRREFTQYPTCEKTIPPVARNILITMGGSDPDNVTGKVLSGLMSMPADTFELIAVIGCGNPHRQSLDKLAAQLPMPVTIQQNVTDMPGLMHWADIAIAAAGSTCYELAYMRLPILAMILADNQQSVAIPLDEAGVVKSLGWFNEITPENLGHVILAFVSDIQARNAMRTAAEHLIDGKGSLRLLGKMGINTIRIRPADSRDSGQLWEWRNDPLVLASAFDSQPIAYEQHVQWFRGKMQQDDCQIYIAINDQNHPLGQVRFDLADNRALIDVAVDPAMRGKGIGWQLIRLGSQRILHQSSALGVDAYIKEQNTASCKAFERAGYIEKERQTMHNTPVRHYEYTL